MRAGTGDPAGTPCDRDILAGIYERQFRELERLRRHILSLLPLRRAGSIFEPGCGTGLLANDIMELTDASYTGMDIDGDILPKGGCFIRGDALRHPHVADMYVTAFFFSSIPDPVPWLSKVRRKLTPGGLFAVFGEYDYEATGIDDHRGLKADIICGLERSGLHTCHGGRLDDYFREAGFIKLHGGDAATDSTDPDPDFLRMHLDDLPDPLPSIKWRIVWGIWRNPRTSVREHSISRA